MSCTNKQGEKELGVWKIDIFDLLGSAKKEKEKISRKISNKLVIVATFQG